MNNREAGDLKRHRGHYDVGVMEILLDVVLMDVANDTARRLVGKR